MQMKAFALVGVANIATAHIKMANPVPFNKASLNRSPLEESGANFPCKFGGGYSPSPADVSNVYAQGSTQKLEFFGQATHGGGSCQVSLTTDLKPTKNSVWKVIKSIQGGCVAKNTPGNMGNSPDAKNPFTYDFTIPRELASGNYTLAWTWFNRIGNREMYMNCAPVAVTGSSGSQSFLNGLPDMFVANAGNGCKTIEGVDVVFPDPGKHVDNFGGPSMSLKPSSGTTGSCKTNVFGGGNGGAPQPASPAAAQPASPPVSQPASPPVAQPAPAENPQPVAPSGNLPNAKLAAGNSAAPASGTGGGSSSSGALAAGTACSGDVWNCIGGSSYQRCANGAWSVVQPLAAGTTCSPGQANELKPASPKQRRYAPRAIQFAA